MDVAGERWLVGVWSNLEISYACLLRSCSNPKSDDEQRKKEKESKKSKRMLSNRDCQFYISLLLKSAIIPI